MYCIQHSRFDVLWIISTINEIITNKDQYEYKCKYNNKYIEFWFKQLKNYDCYCMSYFNIEFYNIYIYSVNK